MSSGVFRRGWHPSPQRQVILGRAPDQTITVEDAAWVGAEVIAPTVSVGYSLTVDTLTVSISVVAPTVVISAITFTPDVLTVATTVEAPEIGHSAESDYLLHELGDRISFEETTGYILLEEDSSRPEPAIVTCTVIAPTISYGAITLLPEAITSATSVVAPILRKVAITLTPDVIESTASVVDADLQTGTVLSPARVTTITSVVAPTVLKGSTTITLADAAAVTATAIAPDLLPGEILRPAQINVLVRAITPTIRPATGVTLTPDVIESIIEVEAPSVVSPTTLLPNIPSVVAWVVAPTVTRNTLTLTAPVVTTVTTVFTPTLMRAGSTFITPDVITSATTVIPPSVGSNLIFTVPEITSIGVVIPPTLIRGDTVYTTNHEGRRQITVDQQQGGTIYPFIEATDDLAQLIGDLYLNYKDNDCALEAPFSIKWLRGFGTEIATDPAGSVHEYDMEIVDAAGTTVFDTREADYYRKVDWGNDDGDYLRVLEWADETTGQILRAVIFTAWDATDEPRDWPVYFEPESARIDPRTIERLPPYVTSLAVITNLADDEDDIDIEGGQNVKLRAGYNAELELLDEDDGVELLDGQPNVKVVQLNLDPGLGLGRFPCEEELYVRRINGVVPDANGNVIFDATNKGAPPTGLCYRIERPVFEGEDGTEVTKHTLKLSNDCGTCCDCDDFINVYEAIRVLTNRYKALGLRAEAVRDQYRLNKQRWEAGASCRTGSRIQVAAEAVAECKVAIAIGLCNTTDGPLTDVELRICFQYGPDSSGVTATSTIAGCILCNTTVRKGNTIPGATTGAHSKVYTLEGTWPRFSARFDCIHPGTNGVVTFVMEFPGCSSSDVVEFVVTADGVNTGGAVPFKTSVSLLDETDTDDCCVSESSVNPGPDDPLCG